MLNYVFASLAGQIWNIPLPEPLCNTTCSYFTASDSVFKNGRYHYHCYVTIWAITIRLCKRVISEVVTWSWLCGALFEIQAVFFTVWRDVTSSSTFLLKTCTHIAHSGRGLEQLVWGVLLKDILASSWNSVISQMQIKHVVLYVKTCVRKLATSIRFHVEELLYLKLLQHLARKLSQTYI